MESQFILINIIISYRNMTQLLDIFIVIKISILYFLATSVLIVKALK